METRITNPMPHRTKIRTRKGFWQNHTHINQVDKYKLQDKTNPFILILKCCYDLEF